MSRLDPRTGLPQRQHLGTVLVLLAALLATSVVAGLIGAGLLMPAVGATGAVARGGLNFFDSLPTELEQSPLAQQSRILAADGSTIATFYDENRIMVPLSSVAPLMRKAIVAVEDARFYQHGGVDPKGLARAFVNNSSGGTTQGASTLTQQYVKLTLQENALANGDQQGAIAAVRKDYARKVQELKYAVTLEKKVDKDKILEGYLNIAYFGDGAYGVEAAARHYFGTTAKQLTLPQSALLAGLVQSPSRYDPRRNVAAATNRRDTVLGRMLSTGGITQAQFDQAKATKITLNLSQIGNGCETSQYAYFCDYVYRSLLDDKRFGGTPAAARKLIFRGGLTVRTTLDPRIQAAAQKAVDRGVPRTDPSHLGSASVVVEPGTGKVLAMAQNRIFGRGNKRGYTQINWSVDNAYGGSLGFQSGSTFKAFTLAAALQQGRALNSVIYAPPDGTPFYGSDFKTCQKGYVAALNVDPYKPYNAEKNESGKLTLLKATEDSVNTAYIKLSSEVGLCEVRDVAENLGVHLAKARGDGSTNIQPIGSLTLGPFNIAPLTMAEAYATFASGGVHCDAMAVTQVTGLNRKPIITPQPKCEQALDPDVANGVTAALGKVLTDGTAKGRGIGRPAAGKTGTTNDSVQSWFIGYTPQLATAVWVGRPEAQTPMRHITVNGQYFQDVYGASIAAPIWQDLMSAASAGLPPQNFGQTSAKVLNGEQVQIPSVSGLTIAQASDTLTSAGFGVKVGPAKPSAYPAGTVAYSTPGGGASVAKGTEVTIYPSTGQPAAAPPQPTQPFPTFGGPGPGGPPKKKH